MSADLDFGTLRAANCARLPTFKNRKGERAHSSNDGSDWALSAWINATAGEAGELAEAYLFIAMTKSLGSAGDTVKKIERGDKSLDEARAKLASEFADVVTYLDILAMRCGIDLGAATVAKFNEVSKRVGSPIEITDGGGVLVVTEAFPSPSMKANEDE